jgi:hypothetical protein
MTFIPFAKNRGTYNISILLKDYEKNVTNYYFTTLYILNSTDAVP